ncbi:ABC transporter permease [Pseudomonas fluorescens]|jgi:osmoprotectant transport system permease protein|uniref:ABC transporter permease n=1 Tax=Pseudomonas fluorescens TaxID=294 RepID=UPI000CA1D24D|nr:ABC transporter permease [Pseudomonas fluorescens]AUM70539.1 quaternary ammonium transporter [Pseudomonas fluorescens]
MIDSAWVCENGWQILMLLVDHFQLVGLSLFIGAVATALMVLMVLWQPSLSRPLTYISGVLFTIPSLALFIFLMPLTGLSKTTSIIGLSAYSLLIILQNALAGFDNTPAEILEEARAMGYTRFQRFVSVELPLAMPTIVAGLRTTAVTLIGMVTVTAVIGQGGLGQLFVTGLTLDFSTPVIVSLILTVAVALFFDFAFYIAEKYLFPWER